MISGWSSKASDGVERRRGRGLKARGGRRETPGEVLKEWRSPRRRGRMGTSVRERASTVVPKKSTNPSPISTSSFRADDSDELAANSWQCSAGGPELPSSAFRSAPSLPPSWSLFASGPAESRGTARTKARFVNSGDAVVSVVSVRPVCPALLRSAPTTSRTSSPAKRTFGGLSRLLSVCGRREGEEGGVRCGSDGLSRITPPRQLREWNSFFRTTRAGRRATRDDDAPAG